MTTKEELLSVTNYGSTTPKMTPIDELHLNGRGDKEEGGGVVTLTKYTGEKDDNGYFLKEEIHAPINLIIFQVRKMRAERDQTGKRLKYTSEVSMGDEEVILKDVVVNTSERINFKEVYAKYDKTKVETYLYAALLGKKGDLSPVKVQVKGLSSFKQENEKEEPMRWTEFLQTYGKDGGLLDNYTTLTVVKEKHAAGSAHRFVFSRGESIKLTPKAVEIAKTFRTIIDEQNTFRDSRVASTAKGVAKEEMPVSGEDPNPSDIPF